MRPRDSGGVLALVGHACCAWLMEATKLALKDTSDVMFVGHRVCWITEKTEQYIRVDQERGIDESGEIDFDGKRADTELF